MREDIKSFPYSRKDSPFRILITGISYCDGTYKIMRKKSPIYCFEYIMEGKGTVISKNQTCYPQKGDVYILHKGDEHLYYSSEKEPWTKIWFNFDGVLADELIRLYNLSNTIYIPNIDLYPLFSEFLENANNNTLDTDEIFSRNAIIFHKILQRLSNNVYVKKESFSADALTLKEYIDKNTEGKISMGILSEQIHRSKSQTVRIFKRAFGKTPCNYILESKIRLSQLYLRNTNMSIKEIAYKLNFTDEHYFSYYFKESVGICPKDYRRNS